MQITTKFEGIPSGDYESFCWDVTRDTFWRITGKPPEDWDKSYYHEGLYRLYENDFFRSFSEDGVSTPRRKFKVSITIEPVENKEVQ